MPRDHVCLCAEDGTVTGTAPRSTVHTTDTPLHRAFSVHLLDEHGRTLLTRRALTKTTWPGVWTNSCCGHPLPGEDDVDAVHRRVREELGATVWDVRPVLPDFRYRATDASGLVENEICPVYTARVDPATLAPDPAEVAETTWLPWADLVAAAAAAPAAFSPWSVRQLALLGPVPPGPRAAPDPAATLDAVHAVLTRVVDDIDRGWAEHLPDGLGGPFAGDDLPRWARRLVLDGGKRLRPTMCHWGFVAAAGPATRHDVVVAAGAALELLHAFALVHDDVMDDSPRRRGEPTAHVRAADRHRQTGARGDADAFGRNLAVLLGDLLHAEADALVGALPGPVQAEWSRLSLELIAGQAADLVGAAGGRTDIEHARRTADLKSGAYTIARPLRLGALAAGGDDDTLAALDRFAVHLGRAFALRDDVLGIWGDPAVSGKPAGDDLRDGKATVVRALAEQALTGTDAETLARAGTPGFGDADVDRLRSALERTGVLDAVERMITEEASAARAVLDSEHIDPAARTGLAATIDRIAWRQS